MNRILVVEDEQHLAYGLKFNFEREGYRVDTAGDGPVALEIFRRAEPAIDLVILDLMLPGMSGYEICKEIRADDPIVPIITLSAKNLPEDRMHAFDCGTDQYLSKPFNLAELLTRVRNLLKRREQQTPPSPLPTPAPSGPVTLGDVLIDFEAYQVTRGQQRHPLTAMEASLLRLFLANPGRVLSRNEILEKVWGAESNVTTRTVDNFVLRLRRLIEADPAHPARLTSVRGAGYRFHLENDFPPAGSDAPTP